MSRLELHLLRLPRFSGSFPLPSHSPPCLHLPFMTGILHSPHQTERRHGWEGGRILHSLCRDGRRNEDIPFAFWCLCRQAWSGKEALPLLLLAFLPLLPLAPQWRGSCACMSTRFTAGKRAGAGRLGAPSKKTFLDSGLPQGTHLCGFFLSGSMSWRRTEGRRTLCVGVRGRWMREDAAAFPALDEQFT